MYITTKYILPYNKTTILSHFKNISYNKYSNTQTNTFLCLFVI